MQFNCNLINGYTAKTITSETCLEFAIQHRADLFPETVDFSPKMVMSVEETQNLSRLESRLVNAVSLPIGFFLNEKMIGWHYGVQESRGRFYMQETGITKEHQGKGVYSQFLLHFTQHLKEMGFQEIYGRHTATNSSVIISKLKAGFVISGFHVSDVYGLMVHLSFFTNPLRQKMIRFRTGEQCLNQELSQTIRIFSANESQE